MAANTASAPLKKRRHSIWAEGSFDMPFLIFLLLVLSAGLICMFSASYVYAYYNDGDSYYYIKRQIIYALVGVAAMLACSHLDYHVWHWASLPLLGISVILLVVVLFLPASDGIHRWIRFPGFQFQPSEVAKFALILTFAHLISKNYDRMKTFLGGVLPFLLILGVVALLVFAEPHLSGTILLVAIGLVMMFLGGTRWWWLVGLLLVGAALAAFMIFVKGYEYDRIQVWQDPMGSYAGDMRDQAWQTVQSLYAIGSGGLWGRGWAIPGRSTCSCRSPRTTSCSPWCARNWALSVRR